MSLSRLATRADVRPTQRARAQRQPRLRPRREPTSSHQRAKASGRAGVCILAKSTVSWEQWPSRLIEKQAARVRHRTLQTAEGFPGQPGEGQFFLEVKVAVTAFGRVRAASSPFWCKAKAICNWRGTSSSGTGKQMLHSSVLLRFELTSSPVEDSSSKASPRPFSDSSLVSRVWPSDRGSCLPHRATPNRGLSNRTCPAPTGLCR